MNFPHVCIQSFIDAGKKSNLKIYFSFLFISLSPYLPSTFWSQLKKSSRRGKWKWIYTMHSRTIADDNEGKAKSNECCFIETKSPPFVHLHHQHRQQQHRQIRARLDDAVMHFSPPSKDSINTDFTNLNAISESGRNSVSRQSLIGECAHSGESLWFSSASFLFMLERVSSLSSSSSAQPDLWSFCHHLLAVYFFLSTFITNSTVCFSLASISSRMVIVRFPVLLFICCAKKRKLLLFGGLRGKKNEMVLLDPEYENHRN